MITSDAFLDVQAAMQVAHAISTNKVDREFDYFTAVGPCSEGEPCNPSGPYLQWVIVLDEYIKEPRRLDVPERQALWRGDVHLWLP